MTESSYTAIPELLAGVTGIIKETGIQTIEDFPKLFTSTTPEDLSLESALNKALEAPDAVNFKALAAELAGYIELDDINMGLMAKCAQVLKEAENEK